MVMVADSVQAESEINDDMDLMIIQEANNTKEERRRSSLKISASPARTSLKGKPNLDSIAEEAEIRQSEYEAFDDFDFDDKLIGDIGVVSQNKVI